MTLTLRQAVEKVKAKDDAMVGFVFSEERDLLLAMAAHLLLPQDKRVDDLQATMASLLLESRIRQRALDIMARLVGKNAVAEALDAARAELTSGH